MKTVKPPYDNNTASSAVVDLKAEVDGVNWMDLKLRTEVPTGLGTATRPKFPHEELQAFR